MKQRKRQRMREGVKADHSIQLPLPLLHLSTYAHPGTPFSSIDTYQISVAKTFHKFYLCANPIHPLPFQFSSQYNHRSLHVLLLLLLLIYLLISIPAPDLTTLIASMLLCVTSQPTPYSSRCRNDPPSDPPSHLESTSSSPSGQTSDQLLTSNLPTNPSQ